MNFYKKGSKIALAVIGILIIGIFIISILGRNYDLVDLIWKIVFLNVALLVSYLFVLASESGTITNIYKELLEKNDPIACLEKLNVIHEEFKVKNDKSKNKMLGLELLRVSCLVAVNKTDEVKSILDMIKQNYLPFASQTNKCNYYLFLSKLYYEMQDYDASGSALILGLST